MGRTSKLRMGLYHQLQLLLAVLDVAVNERLYILYLLASQPFRSGRLDIHYLDHVMSRVRGRVYIIGPVLHVVHDEVRLVVRDVSQLLSPLCFVAIRVTCT